jgi:hypothetical protein
MVIFERPARHPSKEVAEDVYQRRGKIRTVSKEKSQETGSFQGGKVLKAKLRLVEMEDR